MNALWSLAVVSFSLGRTRGDLVPGDRFIQEGGARALRRECFGSLAGWPVRPCGADGLEPSSCMFSSVNALWSLAVVSFSLGRTRGDFVRPSGRWGDRFIQRT